MISKEIAIKALDELIKNIGPYIYGLDAEEIGQIYIKSLNIITDEETK